MRKSNRAGFTLIEILVAVGLVAVLSAGIAYLIGRGPTQASRDARRQADLLKLASALVVYRNDNRTYPPCSSGTSCFVDGIVGLMPNYIASLPNDPQNPTRRYRYAPFDSGDGQCDGTANDRCVRYVLCAALEKGSGSVSGCGSCGTVACNLLIPSE